MWLDDDTLYTVGTSWNAETQSNVRSYHKIDTEALQIEEKGPITDGTETEIRVPYAIAVNPVTKEVYITDARSYLNPGYLHCYSPEGIRQWSVRTGDIPAAFAFIGQ